jgi:hypothetical protein
MRRFISFFTFCDFGFVRRNLPRGGWRGTWTRTATSASSSFTDFPWFFASTSRGHLLFLSLFVVRRVRFTWVIIWIIRSRSKSRKSLPIDLGLGAQVASRIGLNLTYDLYLHSSSTWPFALAPWLFLQSGDCPTRWSRWSYSLLPPHPSWRQMSG